MGHGPTAPTWLAVLLHGKKHRKLRGLEYLVNRLRNTVVRVQWGQWRK